MVYTYIQKGIFTVRAHRKHFNRLNLNFHLLYRQIFEKKHNKNYTMFDLELA